MKSFLNIFTFLALVFLSGWLSGCAKCDGFEPVLSTEDLAWIPLQTLEDSLIFRNQQGTTETFIHLRRNIFTTDNGSNKLFEKTCPEDKLAEGIYKIGKKNYFNPTVDLRVHVSRSNSGVTKNFYWKDLNGNNNFYGFNDHLDSLLVNGTVYRDVHIFVNDTSQAAAYTNPTTYKLYFVKNFGLIRYDNTKNQQWERIH